MGSCLSKPSPSNHHSTNSHVDVERNWISRTPIHHHQGGFEAGGLKPPAYQEQNGATALLDLFKEAHDQGSFHCLRERKYEVWIDNNFRQNQAAIYAIKFAAEITLLLGKAFNSRMKFFFMNYSNPDDPHISQAKRNEMAALETILSSSSWDHALQLVKESESFGDKQLQSWMTERSKGNERLSLQDRRSDDELHGSLLEHVRGLRFRFWRGWSFQDIEPGQLCSVMDKALEKAESQPEVYNSLSFTILQKTAQQRRLVSEENARPTNIILLTSSKLQDKEFNTIKGDLEKVRGGASEFSIQAVVFGNTLGHDGATHHGQLDDHKSGARDIYTASIFNEDTFSRQGPSLSALKRIFNGHSKEVTGKKPKMDQMYGGRAIYGSVGVKNLPEVTEVRQALGLGATSSGMESRETPNRAPESKTSAADMV